MNYFFFILLNGVLVIRPEEIYPDLEGLRLYLILIIICTLLCSQNILAQLTPASLHRRPISVCVIGLFFTLVLSQIVRGGWYVFDLLAPEFLKVILYYFVFVSIIDSPRKLVQFLGWLVLIIAGLTTVALLDYNGVIEIELMEVVNRTEIDSQTGEMREVRQLQATGIYSDPNDLCLILTTGVMCALTRAYLSPSILGKLFWIPPIGYFAYAIFLTGSRGGLLGLIFGLFAFVYARYGWKKSVPFGLLLVPAMLFATGGRQADIDTDGGTAQARFRLWAEGIAALTSQPQFIFTGIGAGAYSDAAGLTAHNSFVHAFVEMGLIGGSLFLGAFYLAVLGLWRIRTEETATKVFKVRVLYPFIFALVLGYAGGCFSISRNYVIPTYMTLGIATVYLRLAYPTTPRWLRFDRRMVRRLALVGIAGFVSLKVLTQVMVRY